MGPYHALASTRTVHDFDMFSLKVSVVVCWLAMVGLEAKPAPALPVGSFSFSSSLGSNSIAQLQPVDTTRTTSRGRVVADDHISYLQDLQADQIDDTKAVQDANEKFLDAFERQIDLINEVRDEGLWSVQPYADNYDYFEEAAHGDYEGDDDEDEEGDGGEEDDDDDDDEDSDEDDSDSSSSSSSEEDSDEEDSDEDDDDDDDDEEDDDDEDEDDDDDDEDDDDDDEEDSDEYDDSSSSSSSSSSSEENGDPALISMKALQALQPKQVEDTPEVEAAKKKFFDSYKAQLELVTNDV